MTLAADIQIRLLVQVFRDGPNYNICLLLQMLPHDDVLRGGGSLDLTHFVFPIRFDELSDRSTCGLKTAAIAAQQKEIDGGGQSGLRMTSQVGCCVISLVHRAIGIALPFIRKWSVLGEGDGLVLDARR